ncbi:MAG: ABC-2 transporter permease [Chloroflexi bacterium]|nr:ABC-2 transporter permease [Chloroflexota bacterium]
MNRILNATKLDFYTARSTLKLSALMFMLVIVIAAAMKQPAFTMPFVMIFVTYLGGTVFSAQEKNHSDKLYGILPLKRDEMIMGRYLYALVIGVFSLVVAGVLSWVIAGVLNVSLDPVTFWIALAFAFVYYGFAVGVAYPIYFKFGFAKASPFAMLPMYLILLGFMLLTRKTNYLNELSQFVKFFADNMYLLPIIGIVGGLLLLAISVLVSDSIYTRKEI